MSAEASILRQYAVLGFLKCYYVRVMMCILFSKMKESLLKDRGIFMDRMQGAWKISILTLMMEQTSWL